MWKSELVHKNWNSRVYQVSQSTPQEPVYTGQVCHKKCQVRGVSNNRDKNTKERTTFDFLNYISIQIQSPNILDLLFPRLLFKSSGGLFSFTKLTLKIKCIFLSNARECKRQKSILARGGGGGALHVNSLYIPPDTFCCTGSARFQFTGLLILSN